jgi:Icc-related predicted phosphoesterase
MINKDFEEFFKILNKNKVKYLVVGGKIWKKETLKNGYMLWVVM